VARLKSDNIKNSFQCSGYKFVSFCMWQSYNYLCFVFDENLHTNETKLKFNDNISFIHLIYHYLAVFIKVDHELYGQPSYIKVMNVHKDSVTPATTISSDQEQHGHNYFYPRHVRVCPNFEIILNILSETTF
jgi:hypothetical protein